MIGSEHAEVLERGGDRDPGWLSRLAIGRGPRLILALVFVTGGMFGWVAMAGWDQRVDDRARAAVARLLIDAPLPSSAPPGAVGVLLRVRNIGPLQLTVTGIEFPHSGVLVGDRRSSLPVRIPGGDSALLEVVLVADCATEVGPSSPSAVVVQVRTTDGRHRPAEVVFDRAAALLTQARQRCMPAPVSSAALFSLTYTGAMSGDREGIVAVFEAANGGDRAVSVTSVEARAGWPQDDPARSTRLPLTLEPGTTRQIRIALAHRRLPRPSRPL